MCNYCGALSQCCSAGAPSSANCSLNSGADNILKVSLSYLYSYSDKYYKGSSETDDKYMKSYFNYTALNLNYSIMPKLQVFADLGFFINKAQKFVQSDYTRYAQGISDLGLGFTYNTYQSDDKTFSLFQTFKFVLPIGEVSQKYDGIVLPIDFQPSSGSNKYNFQIAMSKSFSDSPFSLLFFSSLEIASPIETQYTYQKYGNLYNLSLSGVYKISDNFQASLQARTEIREKALQGNRTIDNTYSYLNASGGSVWFVAPQIAYNWSNWQISSQFSEPIFKNVNGEQLTNKYFAGINISTAFDFGSKNSNNSTEQSEKISTIKLKVNGNCDMCKARIEGIANKARGVISSEWNKETKILTLFYSDGKPDSDALLKLLAQAGHDNEKYIADDEVYKKLPKCCLYRK